MARRKRPSANLSKLLKLLSGDDRHEWIMRLGVFVNGGFKVPGYRLVKVEKIDLSKRPFVPDNWKINKHESKTIIGEDKIPNNLSLSPCDGEIVDLIKYGSYFSKEASATLLDYFYNNPSKIPNDWKGKIIISIGTIFEDGMKMEYFRYLYLEPIGRFWTLGYLPIKKGYELPENSFIVSISR